MPLFGGGDESALSIVLRLRDEASAKLKEVEGRFTSFHSSLSSAASASRTFALGLGAAGAAVGTLGGIAIQAAADMEQTRIAFTTMLGSAEKADAFIRDLVQFAKTTPFELKGLEQASKQLLAYGFSQQEVLPNLKALGDIASGVGMDKLPNLILAFGQVRAATKLTGMELRQFTEAGVPLLDELGKVMGKTVAEIKADMEKGLAPSFDQVRQALVNLSSEGGRFENLMDKQSKSLSGMVSNLRDAWDIFLRGEGQKLLEWGKKFVEMAIYIIQNVLPVWVQRIEALVNWFARHKEAIIIVAGAILGALVPAIYAAAASFAALAVSLAPFIIGGAIIAGIIAGILWIVENWEMLKAKAMEIWSAITSYIKGIVQNAMDFVEQQINRVISAYNRMKEIVTRPVQIVANAVGNAASSIRNILGFEQGGVVPGPVGTPVPIIAHGQETIIPANQNRSSSGGNVFNVSINNPTVRSDDDIRRIEDSVERMFRRLMVNYKFTP